METDQLIAKDMGQFYDDPLGFVIYAYPWDTDPALSLVKLVEPYASRYDCAYGPDEWACQLLDEIGALVKDRGFDGTTAVDAIRVAVSSGHGIGKSALTAWLVDWIMSTRPNAKGIVTANTSEQLSSKTWAEIAKWTRRCITGHWFVVTTGKGAMKMYHKQAPEAWQVTAQTCREENSESFAGLHAADSTPFYIFDESAGIPDKIAEVAEGGLTDGEPMFFMFGNPTRNSGAFHRCFHGKRHRWVTKQIDSRTVAITNKSQIKQWEDDEGAESDFFKVRVRGVFPSQSFKQFISGKDIEAARGKELKPGQYDFAPKILTCDPAWEGDDELVIGLRQGLAFQILKVLRKNDNDIEIGQILANYEDEHQADAVFIDAGYGTGIVSAGRTMGRNWQLIWFSGASSDEGCLNKRAEMWKLARDWLKSGGAIPNDEVLVTDLGSVETVPRLDGKIQLESKKDMKSRGLASPGRGDALALSFAMPVFPKAKIGQRSHAKSRRDYDPFSK